LSVNTTTNNTLIVLSDKEGSKILGWWTGLLWYKWAKKNTPYAAEVLTKTILKEAQGYGLRDMGVVIKWVGMARDWVFKAINEVGMIDIMYIRDETPIQFGWCKWKRPKRN
jgi:small subunit ribosomal protein S11